MDDGTADAMDALKTPLIAFFEQVFRGDDVQLEKLRQEHAFNVDRNRWCFTLPDLHCFLQKHDASFQQVDYAQFRSVIFTSATLSSTLSFDYFATRLGLQDIPAARFESPFNYAHQAMLYLPKGIAEPSSEAYGPAFIDECVSLIRATQGNCFILFTSYRMLSYSAQQLADRISNPLFVQGQKQRSELLQAYMQTDNAVLLGTSSFWEGVDVKGEKLKLVIIDKLPFKSPADPVYRQRLQRANQLGGNAFSDIQIPEAIIALRQGVGRLIRDIHDLGIVMIADNRIHTKPYGRQMISSLPDMTITSSMRDVLQFAEKL